MTKQRKQGWAMVLGLMVVISAAAGLYFLVGEDDHAVDPRVAVAAMCKTPCQLRNFYVYVTPRDDVIVQFGSSKLPPSPCNDFQLSAGFKANLVVFKEGELNPEFAEGPKLVSNVCMGDFWKEK